MNFTIGAIVHLNSGSPDLIITGVSSDRMVVVAWFREDGTCAHDAFPMECLRCAETGDHGDEVPMGQPEMQN